jgi:hypothetical protein
MPCSALFRPGQPTKTKKDSGPNWRILEMARYATETNPWRRPLSEARATVTRLAARQTAKSGFWLQKPKFLLLLPEIER